MRGLWFVAQAGLLLAVVVYLGVGSGCGAKSQLLYEETDAEFPDADVPEDTTPPPPVDCTRDLDCDDGLFCNGAEQCDDGHCYDGRVQDCGEGDDCYVRRCDEERDQCIEMLIAEDADGDGVFAAPCGDDCADTNPAIFPGAQELCNGIDDDCDGDIDEDLVEACEDFGRRRCVDGVWSECTDCTVCIPGARRYCDTPTYCSYGEQICNEAGDGWGDCYETSAPPGCGFAYDEACCVSIGACCQDWNDLDGDWEYDDSYGACEDVVCPSAR